VIAAALLLAATSTTMPTEDAAQRQARELLKKTILVDGHNDLAWAIREAGASENLDAYDLRRRTKGDTDLPRLRAGGVGAQFWSVYVSGDAVYRNAGYARVQLEQIELTRRVIARYPDDLELATSVDEIEAAWKRGHIASLLGMEGGHVLENSMGALRAYYDLGARYLTLTHNVTTDWADSCNDKARHDGLTPFGEEVVREMNRLGMIVDLSHTSPATMADTLRVSEAPVVFTHSNARAVADVSRNVPDEILKKVAAQGGVVMVTFVAGFVSKEFNDVTRPAQREYRRRTKGVKDPAARERIYKEVFKGLKAPKVGIPDVVRHLEHIRQVAGVDHLGLGGDFDGNRLWPTGLEDVSTYPNLFAELIRRGWSEADLKKLAGENFLRAFRQVEEVSRRLRATRKPSRARID
jgi:membrane dipeptidase